MPLALSPILPAGLRRWAEPVEPALQKLLIPARVMRAIESARDSSEGAEFARGLLDHLDIAVMVPEADAARIPASGPMVAVANHPFGIAEGLALASVLDRARPDWRIVANAALAGVGQLQSRLILVNPFETRASQKQNFAPMRKAREWLAGGGLLGIFPAGEVASLNWREGSVTDSPWKTAAARFALRERCPVLPIFFLGENSLPFHLAGALHPALRTLSLAREFQKFSGKIVALRIGNPIPWSSLSSYGDPQSATAYLRSRTFFLANRQEPVAGAAVPELKAWARPVAPAGCSRLLTDEIAALAPECEMVDDGKFAVYLTQPAAIPRLLDEVGRCRERAFREAGEGTGRETDLDHFDRHYQHLLLWSKADSRLAGAYRLAVTSDVLPRSGADGLYTSTLFRFDPRFFERLGPAVELGRSFVTPEYQKSYAPLLLLWKGIARAVQRRPEAPVLFGAVSISNRYQAASRSLIANYLAGRASHELAGLVRPRRRFRHPVMRDGRIRRLASLAAGIEDISFSIADIEHEVKGVPVLLRQYLKAGGRLLGFNLDPNFSDVLDALIAVDLRSAPLELLERCMGHTEARAFLDCTR